MAMPSHVLKSANYLTQYTKRFNNVPDMLRKTSAVLFLLVMTLVITLKHPVLGYCLCLDAYFTGDCICETTKNATSAPASTACQGCCSTNDHAEYVTPVPCGDCTKQLSIDTGDFVWNGSDISPDSETSGISDPGAFSTGDYFCVSQTTPFMSGPIRGDPPPVTHIPLLSSQSLPLYLKLAVLRL